MGTHTPSDAIPLRLTFELRNAATDAVIPLAVNETNFTELCSNTTRLRPAIPLCRAC